MDLHGVLGYVQLTEFVNELDGSYPGAVLSNLVPRRTVNGRFTEFISYKPRIALSKLFVTPNGAAIPLDRGDLRVQGHEIPFRFYSLHFECGELDGLINMNGRGEPDDGDSIVDLEVRQMDINGRQKTNEWLVARCLQGPFTINLGSSVSSVPMTIDYNIPAGNIFTTDVPWTNTGANIISHIQLIKERLRKKGANPKWMIMNDWTAQWIGVNTVIQNYIKEYGAGGRYIEAGEVPMIGGLRPLIISERFADVGMTDAFESPLIDDGKVIVVPDFPKAPGGWIEMQQGTFSVPNDAGTGIVHGRKGVAVYKDVHKNPPGEFIFERILELPVVREPQHVGIINVATRS